MPSAFGFRSAAENAITGDEMLESQER